ncbi:MAG: hypothetical protein L6R36_006840 [Xanthoria steineri]|nr:MAG: hypothetical protein L6R36_006840 [Xanthoria steineri]
MVGMYPDICSIVPFAPELLRDVEEVGISWLQRSGIDLLRFINMELHAQMEIYYSFFSITIPEFINVDIDDRTGTWRIPIDANQDRGAAAGIGVLMTEIDRQATRGLRSWQIYGHGIGAGIGDIFLKGRLLPVEFEGMMHAEMRPELWMLGKPGAVMCLLYPQELPWGRYSGRPTAGSVRANPNALESSLIGRSPPPGISGRRHIDRPLDNFMSSPADRGMNRRMDRGMVRTTRISASHGQPAHRQPLAITDNTVASYFSDDTSTESNLSESESDTPKNRTKTKTTKGKSTAKSAGRGKKETQRRKQSSESESDDAPRETPKKNVKKDKPIGKAASRGRSPSDDEVAYSADEQHQKGKAKASARRRKPEGESQGPSKHGGRRNRGRSPSDDEAPPRVDPTEQARLDALKAQNGYGDGKAEKSGWH